MINPRRLDKRSNDRNSPRNSDRGNNRPKPDGGVKADGNRQNRTAGNTSSEVTGSGASSGESPSRSTKPSTDANGTDGQSRGRSRSPRQSQNTAGGQQNRRSPGRRGPAGSNQKKPDQKSPNNAASAKRSPSGKPKLQAWRQSSVRSGGGEGEAGPVVADRRLRVREDDEEAPSDPSDIFGANRDRGEEILEADKALLFDDDFFVQKVQKEGGTWAVMDEEADFLMTCSPELTLRVFTHRITPSENCCDPQDSVRTSICPRHEACINFGAH